MKSTRAMLLEALARRGAHISLADAAEEIQRAPSATHRQLMILVQEGLVERVGEQKEARYRLASYFKGIWTRPGHPPDGALVAEWTHRGPMDWRYPLVSRVPDLKAQLTLQRFLDTCARRGVFTPWFAYTLDFERNGGNDAWANLTPEARRARLADPANHGPVTVYAYGSCVNGTAREESDLDLIVLYDLTKGGVPPFPYNGVIREIVGDLNLGAPRRIDVRVYAEDEFFDGLVNLYERVRKEILKTAITVYSTSDAPKFIETGRARLSREVTKWTNGAA